MCPEHAIGIIDQDFDPIAIMSSITPSVNPITMAPTTTLLPTQPTPAAAPSPFAAGDSLGNNSGGSASAPGGSGGSTNGDQPQPSFCPLTPLTSSSQFGNGSIAAFDVPMARLGTGSKFPWNQSESSVTFQIHGCITQFAPARAGIRGMSNHVEWWCPIKPASSLPAQPSDLILANGIVLAWTHVFSDSVVPRPSDQPFAHRHVRFEPLGGQLNCTYPDGPPRVGVLFSDSPHKDCAKCPPTKSMTEIALAPPDGKAWHLHGCIEVLNDDAQMYCSWLSLPMGMPCFNAAKVKELVSSVVTCERPGQSGKQVVSDQSVIAGLLNRGVYERPDSQPASTSVLPTGDSSASSGSGDTASGSLSKTAIAAMITVPVVGIAFLIVAAVLYKRGHLRSTRRHSEPNSMPFQHTSLVRPPLTAGPTNDTDAPPITLSSSSTFAASPALIKAKESSAPPPLRTFPNILLHPFPPSPPLTTIDRTFDASLQSLTDAWESCFLALEQASNTYVRSQLPADVDVDELRTQRAKHMAAVMQHVWHVLVGHEQAPASGLVADLATQMTQVLGKTGQVFPGFRLGWPEVGREMVEESAGVYYAVDDEAQVDGSMRKDRARVVRAVVFPGWVDEVRGVVVVRARVIV